MAYPAYIREKAQQLRREKKMTIDELAECLALSRTTIYYWVKDMPIPRTPRQIEGSRRGRELAARKIRRRARLLREAAYEEALYDYIRLIEEPGFRDFVCMYIGEGYKRCRNTVSLGNSDPAVVRLTHFWLCRLSKNLVTHGLQYHAEQDPNGLASFWGAELGVDPAEIGLQRKSNSNGVKGRKWRSRYGVLTVRTSDTQLRAELQAWMDSVQNEWLDSAEVGA